MSLVLLPLLPLTTDADEGFWCAGQDKTDDRCIVGDVPNIFEGDESDHDGPYDGIEMGC